MPEAFQDAFNAELKMPSGAEITRGDSSLPNTAEILSDASLDFHVKAVHRTWCSCWCRLLNGQVILRVDAHERGQSEQCHEGVAKVHSHDEIILFTLNIRRNPKKSSTRLKKNLIRREKSQIRRKRIFTSRDISLCTFAAALAPLNHPLTLNDV